MTTVFTVVGVKTLIYKTLEEDYGILPNGGGSLGGGGSGLTQAEVEAIVNAAVANLAVSGGGLTQAAVDAAIAAAIASLPEPLAQQILDQFGGTVADLTAYVVGVDDNLATTTTMAVATQGGLEQFLTVVAGNPDPSLITVPNGGLPGLAGKAWELVAAVKPAMDQIRTDIASAATKTELQSLVNALCSAPFASMAGNVVNNVNKVGVWVAIVKQEIESLETNLTFVHGKTVENKTAIAALKATVEALEALGVGGGDGTGLTEAQAQMIVDNAAGVATLRAENAALKARLDALEAKTVSLTNDGKLSTADVLGDGFLDAGGNAIVPDLNQGLQLLVDALTWGVEGGYGANGQTIETLYDALVVQSRTLETQAEVAEYLLQRDEWVVENLTALVTYIQEQIAEVAAFSQGIIDAMNGPDATLESIAGMFWLLNDVITALIEATGIELPGKA